MCENEVHLNTSVPPHTHTRDKSKKYEQEGTKHKQCILRYTHNQERKRNAINNNNAFCLFFISPRSFDLFGRSARRRREGEKGREKGREEVKTFCDGGARASKPAAFTT